MPIIPFYTISHSKVNEYILRSIIKWFSLREETNSLGSKFKDKYSVVSYFNNGLVDEILKTKDGILTVRIPMKQEIRIKGAGEGQYGSKILDDDVKQFLSGYQWSTDIQLHLVTNNDLDKNNGTRKLLMFQSLMNDILYKNKSLPIYDFGVTPVVQTELKIQWRFEETEFEVIETAPSEYKEGIFIVKAWAKIIISENGDIVISRTFDHDKK